MATPAENPAAGSIDLVVVGGNGRFARAVLAAAASAGIATVAKLRHTGWPDATTTTVVLDVSAGQAVADTARYCTVSARPLVHAASGLDAAGRDVLRTLAEHVAVVTAPNLSIGHWLQRRLVGELASWTAALGTWADASVIDRHPRTKRDRPSATAVALAELWTAGGWPPPDVVSVRTGPAVSAHTVRVDLPHESIALAHELHDLRAAAAGALLAARAAATAPAGLFPFHRVLDAAVFGDDLNEGVPV